MERHNQEGWHIQIVSSPFPIIIIELTSNDKNWIYHKFKKSLVII